MQNFMRICFITSESKDFCARADEIFKNYSYSVTFLASPSELKDILSNSDSEFDIIIADFKMPSDGNCSIYRIVRTLRDVIPVIFYNEPQIDNTTRPIHWICRNEEEFNDTNMTSFINDFTRIDKILEYLFSDENFTFIEHKKDPRKIRKFLKRQKRLKKNFSFESEIHKIKKLRAKSSMPPQIFSLFEFMYRHKNKALSLKKLSSAVSKHIFAQKKQRTIYSYISRLKKYIEEKEYDTFKNIRLIRTSTGYYKLHVEADV